MLIIGRGNTEKLTPIYYKFLYALGLSQTPIQFASKESVGEEIMSILFLASNDKNISIKTGVEGTYISSVDKENVKQLVFDLLVSKSEYKLFEVVCDISKVLLDEEDAEELCKIFSTAKVEELVDYLLELLGVDDNVIDELQSTLIKNTLKYNSLEEFLPDLYNCSLIHNYLFMWLRTQIITRHKVLRDKNVIQDIFTRYKPTLITHLQKGSPFNDAGLMGDDVSVYGLLNKKIEWFVQEKYQEFYNLYNSNNKSNFALQSTNKEVTTIIDDIAVSTTTSIDLKEVLPAMRDLEKSLFGHNPTSYKEDRTKNDQHYLSSIVDFFHFKEMELLQEKIEESLHRSYIITTSRKLETLSSFCDSKTELTPYMLKRTKYEVYYEKQYEEALSKFKEGLHILKIISELMIYGLHNEDISKLRAKLIATCKSGIGAKMKYKLPIDITSEEDLDEKISLYITSSLAWWKFLNFIKSNKLTIFDVHRELVHDIKAENRFLTGFHIVRASYEIYPVLENSKLQEQLFKVSTFNLNGDINTINITNLKHLSIERTIPLVSISHLYISYSKESGENKFTLKIHDDLEVLEHAFSSYIEVTTEESDDGDEMYYYDYPALATVPGIQVETVNGVNKLILPHEVNTTTKAIFSVYDEDEDSEIYYNDCIKDIFDEELQTDLANFINPHICMSSNQIAEGLMNGANLLEIFGYSIQAKYNRTILGKEIYHHFDTTINYFYEDLLYTNKQDCFNLEDTIEAEESEDNIGIGIEVNRDVRNIYYILENVYLASNSEEPYHLDEYVDFENEFVLQAPVEIATITTSEIAKKHGYKPSNILKVACSKLIFAKHLDFNSPYAYLILMRRASFFSLLLEQITVFYDNIQILYLDEVTKEDLKSKNKKYSISLCQVMDFIADNELLFSFFSLSNNSQKSYLEFVTDFCQKYFVELFSIEQHTSKQIYSDLINVVKEVQKSFSLVCDLSKVSTILESWKLDYYHSYLKSSKGSMHRYNEQALDLANMASVLKSDNISVGNIDNIENMNYNKQDTYGFCMDESGYITKLSKEGTLYYLHSRGLYVGIERIIKQSKMYKNVNIKSPEDF